jgi:hypothetical protein
MKMGIEFNMDNAAFDDRTAETASILRTITAQVEMGHTESPIIDGNGNRVGAWAIVEVDDDGFDE